MDYDRTRAVLAALSEHGVAYKVVGGVALNLLGLARGTKDLDIFVAPDEANVARLRAALMSVFHDASIAGITADDLGGDYPAVQYVPPAGEFHLDILARLGDAFGYEDIDVRAVRWEGLDVPVATPRTLCRMKKDTVRLRDKADVARLRRRFDLAPEDD